MSSAADPTRAQAAAATAADQEVSLLDKIIAEGRLAPRRGAAGAGQAT